MDELNSLEADFTSSRLKDIIQNGIIGDFNLEHLLKFHYTIFQDIYDWAGKIRTIDIEKPEPALGGISIEYSKFENVEVDITSILSTMKSTKWNELDFDETIAIFSKSMAGLWKAHPFREGNTRTVITFCCYYAEKEKFPLDTDLLKDNSDYVRNALVAASAIFHDLGDKSNSEYLIRIIKDAIERGSNIKSPD
ncbi:Fic/DOC family protein [Clostridium sp. CS001]|uniref:Fic/DOC family protein n=1 Tax=Clostridium sp. CS001 TaxID=2880648 RepID=UPI00299E55DB|nr:Fic family protein [Clostridium sp. CS001]